MTAKRIKSALAIAALAGLTVFTIPGAAPAVAKENTGHPVAVDRTQPTDAESIQADGNFYAWEYVGNMGSYCAWYGDDANWSSCAPRGGIRNQASSIENRGYPGAFEDVLVYWDNADDAGGWDGARACIQNGWGYGNLYFWYFPDTGTAGSNERMENNISAHRWVNACTEDPV